MTDLVRALRILRDAAIAELPVARQDGNDDLIHSLTRIFDDAADQIERFEVDVPRRATRCPDCTGLNGAHLPMCVTAQALVDVCPGSHLS
jgi:hypothetical protein